MQSLFDSVREACGPGIWSRGIELARGDSVVGESSAADLVVVRVATRGGLIAPRVELMLEDEDWDCDCEDNEDPCVHVVAAVIAVRRARQEGKDLPTGPSGSGTIGYRLKRVKGALEFHRVVVVDDQDTELRGSLTAIAAGKIDGPSFVANDFDTQIERTLGSRLWGVLPADLMVRLLPSLEKCSDVRVDGKTVSVSREPVLPTVVVEDRGDGFALRLEASGGVEESFRNGLVRCGEQLRPIGTIRLNQREREKFREGEYFAPDQAGRLVSEVLPELRRRIPVEVRTERLPRTESVPPRLILEVSREGDQLVAAPQLVYGDPPTARIVEGKLVPIEGTLPLRNEAAESSLRATLRRELKLAPAQSLHLDPADAIEFSRDLRFFSGKIVGDAHQEFFLAPPLAPVLKTDASQFDLEFAPADSASGASSEKRVGAMPVLNAWREGSELVGLPGGGFAPLPSDWLERFGRQVDDLLSARDARGELPASALPDLGRLCEDLGKPVPPGFERLRALVEDFSGLPEAELPDGLQAELRPYQELGVRWLTFLRDAGLGGLLADDMGLGKTLQALCSVRGRTLVVAPTSVVFGWEEQARNFRPDLKVSVYHGPKRTLDPDADLTLTTYAILRIDADLLATQNWDSVVLDEAQAIKNPDSQVARAAFRLEGDARITLTGTPVENRLEELWSQLQFLNPGLLGTRSDFRDRYAKPISEGDPAAAAHLRSRIRPFVLRRLKSEVAPELPPRTEAVLHVELAEAERGVYDAIRAATRDEVVAKLRAGGSVIQALEALLRLRQAACHSALVPGQQADASSKLDVLLENLDEAVAEGHKVLVFSQWTSLLDLVEPELDRAGIRYARLDGSTRDRGAVVESFQSADGPPVMLISLRAGGTGLNLTAADHVFLLDPWWNPAVEDQAEDRAHRIGQENPVSIYRLVARDTVEERILGLQARKRELAQAALGEADGAGAITREELLSLLD